MIVNGKNMEFDGDISVKDLLSHMNVDEDVVVVEVDFEILPKDSYETHILDESSRVEIVAFVGGG
ncbi:sulfur carrier protein ThiS [Peptoclostridium litorale]|uniref:sulfur carrier protein ThiS n=1 Tax=Peptoclostridium litorale TaxID=1557 RepID=UPI000570879E|nr:sulfur carrier protein ThiS [Peptoclostridium litorale]